MRGFCRWMKPTNGSEARLVHKLTGEKVCMWYLKITNKNSTEYPWEQIDKVYIIQKLERLRNITEANFKSSPNGLGWKGP